MASTFSKALLEKAVLDLDAGFKVQVSVETNAPKSFEDEENFASESDDDNDDVKEPEFGKGPSMQEYIEQCLLSEPGLRVKSGVPRVSCGSFPVIDLDSEPMRGVLGELIMNKMLDRPLGSFRPRQTWALSPVHEDVQEREILVSESDDDEGVDVKEPEFGKGPSMQEYIEQCPLSDPGLRVKSGVPRVSCGSFPAIDLDSEPMRGVLGELIMNKMLDQPVGTFRPRQIWALSPVHEDVQEREIFVSESDDDKEADDDVEGPESGKGPSMQEYIKQHKAKSDVPCRSSLLVDLNTEPSRDLLEKLPMKKILGLQVGTLRPGRTWALSPLQEHALQVLEVPSSPSLC